MNFLDKPFFKAGAKNSRAAPAFLEEAYSNHPVETKTKERIFMMRNQLIKEPARHNSRARAGSLKKVRIKAKADY